jgi:hypothetical protein
VAELAARARVSNRSVLQLESTRPGERLEEVLGRSTSERKRAAWARVLTKVAVQLRIEPAEWFDRLGKAGVALPAAEADRMAVRAEQSPSMRRAEGSTLAELRKFLRLHPSDNFPLPVHLLLCGPKGKAQRELFWALLRILVSAVSPRFEPHAHDTIRTFDDLMEGLSSRPPKYRLGIGPFQLVGRSPYPVSFTALPGWRIRLACLAAPEAEGHFTFQDVRDEPTRKRRDQKGLTVWSIDREAGDVYLRGFCNYTDILLTTLRNYNLEEAARGFRQALERGGRQARHTVFVVGEYEAATIHNLIRQEGGPALVDLAARKSADAPRYPLALTTAEDDRRWTEAIRAALVEVFRNGPNLIAELYGQYILDVIDEAIEAEPSATDRAARKKIVDDLLGLHDPDKLPPSYLEVEEIELPGGAVAGKALRDRLREALEQGIQSSAWFAPEGAAVADYVKRLAPWVYRDPSSLAERLDHIDATLVAIRKKLARLGRRGGARG